jgi:DNA polymerase-3 subunit delta'
MAFKDIIGHKGVINLLKSYIKEERVHHTYLFVGPKGVGKTTVALNFAKALNCENLTPDTEPLEPCDKCRSCRAIDEGYHPDVRVLNLQMEVVRKEINAMLDECEKAGVETEEILTILNRIFLYKLEPFFEFLKDELTGETKREIGKKIDDLQVLLNKSRIQEDGSKKQLVEEIKATIREISELLPEKRMLGIEAIKAIRQSAYSSAIWGGWKVNIIGKAEVLTREAGDALLKVLEEPPERCIFILLAPNVGDIPPTIVSRSHIIKFHSVEKEEISHFLREKYAIDKDLAYALASLSEGRPGFAIKIAKDEKLKKARENTLRLLMDMPLNPDYSLRAAERFSEIASQIKEGEDKDKIQRCLLFASSFFRDLLILQLAGNSSLLINYDKKKSLERIHKNYSLDFLHSALSALQRTYRLLQPGLNFEEQLCLEVMFLDMLGGR